MNFLNEAEVAKQLGLSPQTLRIWRMKGDGPPFCKFGKAVRYNPASVQSWAEAQEKKHAAQRN